MSSKSSMLSLINVIIPVYGVEHYLPKCVDNVLAQSYSNIRVILIDDGSPDECPCICDDYAALDSRVVALHRQNGGLSAARNTGLEYLFSLNSRERGKYVVFVDSDDWVDSDYIESLYNLIVAHNADIAQCGHYISYSNAREECKNRDHSTKTLTRIEAINSLCRNGVWDVTVWNKLYKMDLFQDIRFPEGKSYEDTATCYLIAAQCNHFVVNMTPKYHYVQRYSSIANGTVWRDSKFDLIEAGDAMADWVQVHYPQLSTAAMEKRVFVRLSTLAQMVNTGHKDAARIREMRRFIIANARTVLCDANASRRNKLGILALMCSYSCYKIMWKIYYLIKRRRRSGSENKNNIRLSVK